MDAITACDIVETEHCFSPCIVRSRKLNGRRPCFFTLRRKETQVTISAGVASYAEDIKNEEELSIAELDL